MDNYIYINAYALGWIILFLLFIIKNRALGIGGIILLTYCISSLSSNYFYTNTIGFERTIFSFPPFIFLFTCIFICILPLLIHSKELCSLQIKLTDKMQIVYIFLLLCTPIIIEGFLEISYIAFKTNSTKLVNIYESEVDIIGSQLSFIGRKTLAIIRWFQYLWPILFFYCIAKGNKYKKFSIIMMLAFISGLLEGYAGASRVTIIRSIFYFLIVYILFKSSLSIKTIRIINICIIVSISLIGGLLALITISRFNALSSNIDIFTWISLYTGEGELRFAQHLWDLKETTNGDTCFSLFKQILGLDTFTDLEARRAFYEMKLKIPTTIFYTYIGDWYQDLGASGTILFCIAIAIIQEKFIRRIIKRKYLTICNLLFLSMIICIFIFGIMYYVFKSYMVQVLILPNIIWAIIYNIKNNKKYKSLKIKNYAK
ncbi:O-antigen polymerase [Phocaeicola plebeius]|uniref:O-antigen polymerase n=1 Tax=Phocaeicola plebeius TaxID=310297 RepID=UPI004025BE1B